MENIPMMPFPYKSVKGLVHGFNPVSSMLVRFFPAMEMELEESGIKLSPNEYLGSATITFAFYFSAITLVLGIYASNLAELNARLVMLSISLVLSLAIASYILSYPKWVSNKKKIEVERDLLFAMRHLMVQTGAGVPLFESIVSISEEYEDRNFNYGQISREFKKMVKEVRGGKELSQALEESAAKNTSRYYRRVMWQLANANKAGANIGTVLKEIVEFLSSEQLIMIRNYGAQLNPLALFYMLTCIIAPTMGLVLLSVITSLVEVPVNELSLGAILVLLVVLQIMFIGLIKSRRPTVAL